MGSAGTTAVLIILGLSLGGTKGGDSAFSWDAVDRDETRAKASQLDPIEALR